MGVRWIAPVICLWVAAVAAMPAGQLETHIRSEGFTVLVDVVVTDESNRTLEGLGPQHFRVYEDGVLQAIDAVHFLPAAGRGLPSRDAGDRPITSGVVIPGDTARDPVLRTPLETARNVVVLVDLTSMDVDSRVRLIDALRRWFREDLPPRTQVALFAITPSFRLVAPFTDKPDELAEAVEALKEYQSDIASADASLLQPLLLEPFLSGAAEDSSGYQGRRLLDSLEVAQPELLKNPFTLRIIRAFLAMQGYVQARHAGTVLDAVQAIVEGLSSAPGRNLLILASEGLVVGGVEDRKLFQTAEMAKRLGVVIYVVQPQGLETHGVSSSLAQRGQLFELNAESAIVRKDAVAGDTLFDRAKVAGSDLPDETLRYLADSTGGFVVRNTNDLLSGFREITRKGMAYYLIAYRSSRPEYDGATRYLKVEVNVQGARVSHRSSYRAVPPEMEALSTEQYRLWRAVELGEHPLTLSARGNVFVFPTVSLSNNIAFVVETPVEALEWRPSPIAGGDTWVAQLTLDSFLQDISSEAVVWARRIPLNIHLTREEREILHVVTFGDELAVLPGKWQLTVLLDDVLGGACWKHQTVIQVPSLRGPVQASDLVVGKRLEPAPGRSGLLTIDGATLVPAVEREFHPQDRLFYYLRICCTSGQVQEVSFSLVKREGTSSRQLWQENVPWSPAGAGCRPIARWIPLARLDPGLYFLTATITTPTAEKALERRTWFRLKVEDGIEHGPQME